MSRNVINEQDSTSCKKEKWHIDLSRFILAATDNRCKRAVSDQQQQQHEHHAALDSLLR
jgi:hypothetical protein